MLFLGKNIFRYFYKVTAEHINPETLSVLKDEVKDLGSEQLHFGIDF